MGKSLEHHFERYRRRGDLRALARVFDGTARDLLTLAHHLVRDLDDAEDLLQETFVVAIDRASAWDARRPLRPWLSGILAKQAANLSRSKGRRRAADLAGADGLVEDGRSVNGVPPGGVDPARAAAEAEVSADVRRALERIGERYRSVLEPYLVAGDRPEEIARRLGRSPGTVRTQIHRGLERLRRLLPAGIGAGAFVGVAGIGGRMEVVRATVLAHAGRAAATAPLAASAATAGALSHTALAWTGGMMLVKKTAILTAGAAVVATSLGYWVTRPAATPRPAVSRATPPTVGGPTLREELPAESVAPPTTADAPLRAAPSTAATARTAVRRGSARALVELDGVRPRDLDSIAVQVRIRTLQDQPIALERLFGHQASVLSGRTAWLDATAEAEFGALDVFVSGDERSSLPPITPDAVTVDRRRGTLEIDVTSALGLEEASQGDLRLTFEGETYFPGSVDVSFGTGAAERIAEGDELVEHARLALDPAAVLRGKVAETREQAAHHVSGVVLDASGGLEVEQIVVARTLVNLSVALADSGEDGVWQIVVHDGTGPIEVALLREGAPDCAAAGHAGWGGEFELKLREDGPFVLVALAPDRPPLVRRVDLALHEIVELEEDLEIGPGPVLEGYVEDMGAFPDGGIALRADRLSAQDDRELNWGRDLMWSGGDPVRRLARTTTGERGTFQVRGLSPGVHRLSFANAGIASLFPPERLEELAVDAPVPARDVQMVLPLAVLDLELVVPRGPRGTGDDEEEDEEWTELVLRVLDPESGAELASAALGENDWLEPAQVVGPAGLALRIEVRTEGVAFPDWEGVLPAVGARERARIEGSLVQGQY